MPIAFSGETFTALPESRIMSTGERQKGTHGERPLSAVDSIGERNTLDPA